MAITAPGALAAGYYQKPFPAADVTTPTTAPYQFYYNGFYIGPNSAFELKKINGLWLPNVRSGDSGRPREHGLFAGLDVLGGSEVTLEGDLHASSEESFQEALENLALVTAPIPDGVTETPLYFNLPGYGLLVKMCRVRKREIPIDITYVLGELASVAVLLASIDPRVYSAPTVSQSVTPPGTGGGFTFPLKFPLKFAGSGPVGELSVVNAGNIDSPLVMVIEGPCHEPSITLASAPGAPNLTFELSMNEGDRLVLSSDLHTALYYTAGSSFGADRLDALAEGSQWFSLPAGGTSTIQFLTNDPEPTGLLTVESCSARII